MANGKKGKDGSLINSSNNKKKTARKCYKLSTKIKLVEEYKSHHPRMPMTKWLEKRNLSSDKNCQLAYSSFKAWVTNYDAMIQKSCITNEGEGKMEQKKLRVRPFKEIENILAEYLRLRNIRLRSEGKPISSSNFIKKKAKEFYADLYGEEKAQLFKASAGWAFRFQHFFKSILEPPPMQKRSQHEDTETENKYDTDDDDDDDKEEDAEKDSDEESNKSLDQSSEKRDTEST